MKNTFVIKYRHMKVGGIENYIISLIKVMISKGYRVVWLCDPEPQISSVYSDTLNNGNVERCICDTHGFNWLNHDAISFSENENVTIMSFSVCDFLRTQSFKEEFKKINIKTIYAIPHFTGALIFPEQGQTFFSKRVKKFYARLYQEFVDAGRMFYFSPKHIEAIEKGYSIKIPANRHSIVPDMHIRPEFDIEKIAKRYNSNEFKIVSAGRLEFPHKGFVMGMLDVFAELKQKYPFLVYYIVGEGEGIIQVQNKINEFPKEIAESIHCLKSMEFEKLLEFYSNCNLNISAAGCASYGASIGLLTLPVRHYTYECEVYGFLPESKPYVLETKPGDDVKPYIEQVINMSLAEYTAYCKKSYDGYETQKVNPDIFFDIEGYDSLYVVNKNDIKKAKFYCNVEKILFICNKVFSKIKH